MPALAAAAAFAASLGGGRLSDDFLLNYLLDTGRDDVVVAWDRVLADFHRPWLGLEEGRLYRPLVSVSFAVDCALGGGQAWVFHLTNVLLHVLTSAGVAWLCLVCARPASVAGALTGGTLFALHPAAVETVAWIAARVSGLETALSVACLVAHLRWRRTGRRGWLGLACLLALLSVASKESAAILPFSLLAVDLLAAGDLRRALRAQVPYLPVWAVYAVVRWSALGSLLGPPQAADSSMLASYARTLPAKLAILAGGPVWPGTLAAIAVCVGLVGSRLRLAGLLLAVLAWVHLALVPAAQIDAAPPLGGSRLVYGATAGLALWFASAVGATARTPAALRASVVVALALAFVVVGRQHWRHYERCYATIDRLRAELLQHGATATPQRPVVVLATPSEHARIPVLNPNQVFALAERPFAPTNQPLVGLNFLLVEIADMRELFLDMSPLRAMLETGAPALSWLGDRFDDLRAPPPRPLELHADGPGRFSFAAGKTSPLAVECLELLVEGRAVEARVRWLPAPDVPSPLEELMTRVASSDRTTTRLFADLSHSVGFLARAHAGGVEGFAVEAWQDAGRSGPARVLAVRALPRLVELATSRLEGTRLVLGREQDVLLAPSCASDQPLRLVLLGPHAGYAIAVVPGQPVSLPARVARDVRRVWPAYRQKLSWLYFEAGAGDRSGTPAARSRLDWVRIEAR